MTVVGLPKLHRISSPDYPNPETVASLARYTWAVDHDSTIGTLVEEWRSHSEVPVLGVVTPLGFLLGTLSSVRFYAALARPYGWEVLKKKPVTELMEPFQVFSGDDSLFLLSEKLASGTSPRDNDYYAVSDRLGRFQGFFSQEDLVSYLARMTQQDLLTAQALQGQLVKGAWSIDEGSLWAQGICEMFKGVGGDFSTLRQVAPGRWFGCVCDVSGKGIAASLVTMLVWGLLESVAPDQPLVATVNRVNAAVCKAFQGEKFVSGFFWTYDETDGRIDYADMGHSHEMFWVSGILKPAADTPNLPLGIDETLDIVPGSRILAPGDGLLVYTDGAIENVWKTASDFSIEGALTKFLSEKPGSPALGLVASLTAEMGGFRKRFPVHDDVTLVWFQRK